MIAARFARITVALGILTCWGWLTACPRLVAGERGDGQCIAFASVAGLPLNIEQYQGTSYFFLNHGELRLTIDVAPDASHALDVLWGSKDDMRSALITVHGVTQSIRAGGYDGFRWLRVPLPPAGSAKSYPVVIGRGDGKVAFIAAVRLVDARLDSESEIEAPQQNRRIEFDLPVLQDGWPAVESYADLPELERNGRQAQRALEQSHRFVLGWLQKADPESGLIPENLGEGLDRWNGRNNGADNYPFMVLTAALTDRSLFEGRLLDMLRTEERLTSRIDRLGDSYRFSKRGFEFDTVDLGRIIFDNSEYVKDGLMPLTEWLGPSPWSQRMAGLIDDIWKHAPVETSGGNIPSTSAEVNGEMMQVTARYYWMTGDRQYLDFAARIADWYLLSDRHPTRDAQVLRLRDHGCELVSGLTEVYFACAHADPPRAALYREPLHGILDCILEFGVNEHGMMYNAINPQTGQVTDRGLSDTWGYNYNGFYTCYLVDGVQRYREAVRRALGQLHHYRGYPWEGTSHDGYADSIESAINLYNREPVAGVDEWIDSQMRIMLAMQREDGIIGGWHGDGNFARTAIMYALWKQQGVTCQPWRADLRLGAQVEEGRLRLLISADRPWTGRLVFDIPRHKTVLRLPMDYPRINQFPEWFTVKEDQTYRVTAGSVAAQEYTGGSLRDGLWVALTAEQPRMSMLVEP